MHCGESEETDDILGILALDVVEGLECALTPESGSEPANSSAHVRRKPRHNQSWHTLDHAREVTIISHPSRLVIIACSAAFEMILSSALGIVKDSDGRESVDTSAREFGADVSFHE